MPRTTRIATAGSGPTAASAIGSATIVEPTVSVSVSAYAVQNGDIPSRRAASAARAQRSRSPGRRALDVDALQRPRVERS